MTRHRPARDLVLVIAVRMIEKEMMMIAMVVGMVVMTMMMRRHADAQLRRLHAVQGRERNP